MSDGLFVIHSASQPSIHLIFMWHLFTHRHTHMARHWKPISLLTHSTSGREYLKLHRPIAAPAKTRKKGSWTTSQPASAKERLKNKNRKYLLPFWPKAVSKKKAQSVLRSWVNLMPKQLRVFSFFRAGRQAGQPLYSMETSDAGMLCRFRRYFN